ncbi:hypothetical protein DAH54_14310, partial [Sphingomonas koreensis]
TSSPNKATMPCSGRTQRRLSVDSEASPQRIDLGQGKARTIAKAMAVVLGEAEIYLHSGGQHQWDNCAPVAVALAAGLHASRIDGSPLVYNQPGSSMPDLLICRRELADTVLDQVAKCDF